jgi:superfamily II DNA or RNA helicase
MNQINDRLQELYLQKKNIEEEINLLESKLKENTSNENSKLSKNEKIKLFKTLFISREDIFAKKWISKDGLKQGFYPVTQTFKGSDFIPLSNKDIELHLRGQHQLASYLINKENRSKYIVFEIADKQKDIWKNIFNNLSIDALFEFSSYNSVLIWVFFDEFIETKDAKKFATYILKKINTSAKIYPTQEFATNASLADCIELPLHWKFRDEQKTVFFDAKTNNIYDDQWKILQNIKKVTKQQILKYIEFEKVNINTPAFENIDFPNFKLDIKLYDYLYIPTINLSKTFINKLKTFASFDNPQVKILLSLRKPLYNTPRVIKNFEEDETYLKLPRGLIYTLEEFLIANSVTYEIENKTFFQRAETKKVKFELRDEQKIAIEKIVENDFSICVAPPGFGKTLIGAKMFEIRKCNTLIIVNKNMLLNQWIERFVDYFAYSKKDIGYLGKGHNKLNGTIDVATMQSLKNNTDIINDYTFVIVDECHHIPAITFEQIIKNFFGRYILGLSATPNRKDGLEPILYEQLGRVAYEFKKKKTFNNKLELVKTDFVSSADNYATLINELCVDENRNNLIIKYIKRYKDRKILVLTDRIEHINNLEKSLLEEDLDFVCIHGSMNKKDQNKNMKLVEHKSLIVATTSYFGEGIDFPHLNTIIFATPISYYGRLVQYLGRIGRGNQECLAIDFLDHKNAMLNAAYKKRLEGYKQMHYI